MIDPKLVGDIAPAAAPDGLTEPKEKMLEEAVQKEVPTAPEIDLTDLADGVEPVYANGLGKSSNLLASEPVRRSIPDREVLIGASGIINVAVGREATTPEYLEYLLNPPAYVSVGFGEVIQDVYADDQEVAVEAARGIATNPNLSTEQKVGAIEQLVQTAPTDVNVVQRTAMDRVAIAEYAATDDDDDEQQLAVRLKAVQDIPEGVEPIQDDAVYAQLNQLYAANKGAKWGDVIDLAEQITPMGSLPSLNEAVANIYQRLGLDAGGAQSAESYLQVGTAMKRLRIMYREAPPQEKLRIARTVLDVLQEDSGFITDSNAFVVVQVMETIMPKEFLGEDVYAGKDVTDQQKAALDAQIAAARAKGDNVLVQQLLAKRYPVDATQMMDNAFNLLDYVGLGAAAREGMAFGKKNLPPLWRRMFGAAPDTGARRLADAASDPSIAKQMGMTQADAVHAGLPNSGKLGEAGANALEVLRRRDLEARAAVDRVLGANNFTKDEQAQAFDEIVEDVNRLADQRRPKLQLNRTSITPREDGTGVDVEAVFGRTTERGFATYGDATKYRMRAIEDMFGKDAPVDVLKWDDASQSYIEVPKNTPADEQGQFFLRVRDERKYSSARRTWGAVQLGDDSVANLTLGASVSRWTRATNVFSNFLQNLITSRAKQLYGLEQQANPYFRPILDLPEQERVLLGEVIQRNEGRVLTTDELLQEGLTDKGVVAYQSFRALDDMMYDMLDKQLRIEKQRAGLLDIVHNGQRIGFGKPLKGRPSGNVRVYDPDTGEFLTLSNINRREAGELIEQEARVGLRRQLRREGVELTDMATEGRTYAKLEYPIVGKDGRTADYIVTSSRSTKVLPVPMRGILPRIPGHYPHIQRGNFVLYGTTKDGQRRAFGLAADEATAQRIVAQRKARTANRATKGKATGFVDFKYEYDGSLARPERLASKMDEVIQARQGLLFGKRTGRALTNYSPQHGDTHLDPVAALLEGYRSASQLVTKGELIASLRKRVANYAKSIDQTKYNDVSANALTPEMIRDIASTANKDANDKILSMLKQIELMEGVPDAYRQAARSIYQRSAFLMTKVANMRFVPRLGRKGLTKVEQKVESGLQDAIKAVARSTLAVSRTAPNPMSGLVSAMHKVYIAMAPVKQMALNVAQTTVALSIHPTQTMKFMKQMGPVAAAVSMRLRFMHGADNILTREAAIDRETLEYAGRALEKVTGMKGKEFADFVDMIVERGIIDATAHNSLIRDSIGEYAQRRMTRQATSKSARLGQKVSGALRTAQDVANFVPEQASKLGFQAGENFNQVATMLIRYNADKAAGKANLADQRYVDELVGWASEVTGNMIPDASFAYTRSGFKAALQWVQFSHKMILLTLPRKLGGSSQITGMEKARLAAMQFLMYGTAGNALTDIGHKLIEQHIIEKQEATGEQDNSLVELWRSPQAKAVFDGFMIDYTANKVLHALFGETDDEWNDFDISKAVAPGSGHTLVTERVIGLFTLDKDAVLGTQANFLSNLNAFGSMVSDVALANLAGQDDVPFDQRAEQIMKRGATTLIPSYGNYLAGRWMYENDMALSRGGKLMEGFDSELELMMATAFGINTKDRNSYYEARERLFKNLPPDQQRFETDKLAQEYWQRLIANSTKFRAEAGGDTRLYFQLMQDWSNEQALVFSVLPREDAEHVNRVIAQKLQDVASGLGDTAETEFVASMSQALADGGIGSKGPEVASYLRNLEFVKNNPERAYLIEEAWQNILSEKIENGELPSNEEGIE